MHVNHSHTTFLFVVAKLSRKCGYISWDIKLKYWVKNETESNIILKKLFVVSLG